MEMNSEQAKLHLVGKAKLRGNVIVDIELSAVLYEKSFEMKFRDKDEIFFVLPFDAETGVEGAYLRIIEAIGEVL
ncbi:hypothetical protein TBCH5v1_0877 [Thermococcus barophilus]|uniref:Uncharacterized protein n=2 Tax=Thermococcus barophilus TaxID=55802 RepID=A0A0S1XAK7_THEBA|nr:hypothetical protein TBCH5v1_0877 [Thermococcus barophilus]